MEKVIESFPMYSIDRNGSVFSKYKPNSSKESDSWKELQQVLDKGTGYYLVTLCNNGLRKNQFIHRLLALHFVPNPENKPQVNHIDGNKQNNALTNLEWVTSKENSIHAVKMGLCHSRIEATQVSIQKFSLSGDLLAEYVSLHEAGRANSVAWQNIWKVANGRRKTAGGFVWKYK